MAEIVSCYKCVNCEKVLTTPESGVVVHGNIYVADPVNKGGLVGNNFPTSIEDCKFETVTDAVKETAYCVPCFLNAVLPNYKLSATRSL